MTRIVWADPVRDLVYELPEAEQNAIFEHLVYLSHFPHRIHVRKVGKIYQVLKNSVLLRFREFVNEISYWIGPNDPCHWRFLALRLARAFDLRTTSSCGVTRPARIARSDSSIIFWKAGSASIFSRRSSMWEYSLIASRITMLRFPPA